MTASLTPTCFAIGRMTEIIHQTSTGNVRLAEHFQAKLDRPETTRPDRVILIDFARENKGTERETRGFGWDM